MAYNTSDSTSLVKESTCSGSGPLDFTIIHNDGGQYSEEYGPCNLLKNDSSCYCSEKREGVNLVLKFKGECSFTLSHLLVRAPKEGFTAPLGRGILTVHWENPVASGYLRKQQHEDEEAIPFDVSETYSLYAALAVPRSGRYIHVKFLGPRNAGENVDVQYLGFWGWSGPRGFDFGSLR